MRGFGVEAVVRIEKDRPFVIVERALTIDE
jgi:hypothetical protein